MNVHKPTNDLNDFRIQFCERLADILNMLSAIDDYQDFKLHYSLIQGRINYLFSILYDESPAKEYQKNPRIHIIQALEHLQELSGKISVLESIKDDIKSELEDALIG